MLTATRAVFDQILPLLEKIREEDYRKLSPILSGSTIGQHVRHVVEFYQCLCSGYVTGCMNYDNRQRNKLIEEDTKYAASCILAIQKHLEQMSLKTSLKMVVDYSQEEQTSQIIQTTVERELVYNIEHAVHHMALIKIGIRDVAGYLSLPENFGVAVSTIKYKEKCAQ